MRTAIGEGLDKAESREPGTGLIDAGIFGRGNFDTWQAGGYLDAEARLTEELSLFGSGEAGYDSGLESGYWVGKAGARVRF